MPHDPLDQRLLRLQEALNRIAHNRGTLADYRDLIVYADLRQTSSVTRFRQPDDRGRINFGRRATKYDRSNGILIAFGKHAFNSILDDTGDTTIPRETLATPPWDAGRAAPRNAPDHLADITINHHSSADTNHPSIPTEDALTDAIPSPHEQTTAAADGSTGRDAGDAGDAQRDEHAPYWCTAPRIATAWHNMLQQIRDPDTHAVLEHTTTLTTLLQLRLIDTTAYGHYQFNPPLGRDGRVQLPDAYHDVPVICTYTPATRLVFDLDRVEALGAQSHPRYDPEFDRFDMPDFNPPSNGVFDA